MESPQPAVRVLVRQLDDAYGHRFESLTAALEGVTPESAFRQPAAYAREPSEDGWPPPGSIAWQIAHVTHCKRYYTELLRRVGTTESPAVPPWTPCETLDELRAGLAAAHVAQRDALSALSDADLARPVGDGTLAAGFVSMIIRHDAWHGSQIAVARRLLEHEAGPAPSERIPSATG